MCCGCFDPVKALHVKPRCVCTIVGLSSLLHLLCMSSCGAVDRRKHLPVEHRTSCFGIISSKMYCERAYALSACRVETHSRLWNYIGLVRLARVSISIQHRINESVLAGHKHC